MMVFLTCNWHRSVVLLLMLVLMSACKTPEKIAKKYTNNDSTAIFSTHPSRPFKYGHAYTKAECYEHCEPLLKQYKLKSGDIVADIGAASGWKDGIFSVMLDSVTFYIEDIDTNLLNKDQFNKVVTYYTGVRGKPQTNTFHMVLGTKKSTNLPDSLFDKVIMENTLHELSNPFRMVSDISRKLRPGGKLLINEDFSNSYKVRYVSGCGTRAYTLKDAVEIMELSGLYLTNMTEPENSFENVLTFQKDDNAAVDLKERMASVDPYIKALDGLYQADVAGDSLRADQVRQTLKAHLREIQLVYTTLENYLVELGYRWIDDKAYKASINTFIIARELYPASAEVDYGLGDAYMENRQYGPALASYAACWEKKPEDHFIKESIRDLLGTIQVKQ